MSKEASAKPKRARRPLASLVHYPDQDQFFDDLPDHELKELAEDIKRNGLKHPIEVLSENQAGLPPDTILRGHQRLRALHLLGCEETTVRVRYDLAEATRDEIDRVFLGDNVHRRQLDPLAKARAGLRLLEIEKGREPGSLKPGENSGARERVGKILNMSGRNLDRYIRVLAAPTEIQDAFRRKELSLVEAAKVAGLKQRERNELVSRLRAGEPIKQVVAAFLKPASSRTKTLLAFDQFTADLATACHSLQGREDRISDDALSVSLPVLTQAHAFLGRLVSRANEAPD